MAKILKPIHKHFTVWTDQRGVTTVALDVVDRPMNIMTHEVMQELRYIVESVKGDSVTKMVVFTSAKESGFLAGADVNVIDSIESADVARQLIEGGQQLFREIEQWSIPTIAAIHGPCLGGGLEWALACDYRVARDNSATQLGLPEIKLGLIPGWGGTQRLPKLIGLSAALPMILTGKQITAKDAFDCGLVDRAIEPEEWTATMREFTDEVLQQHPRMRRPNRRSLGRRLLESNRWGRRAILRAAQRSIESKQRHYPALQSALIAVTAGYEKNVNGYDVEKSEFINVLSSTTCRNLLHLFFARERARNTATWVGKDGQDALQKPIQRVGVVGAGAMGAGIAQLAVSRGFQVVVAEVDEDAAAAGRVRIDNLIDQLVKRKRLDSSQRDQMYSRVKMTTHKQELAQCNLVIEAAVEQPEIKAEIFRDLDKFVASPNILASNTSSLSITDMAAVTKTPHRVAGLHFFNPVHRMELVEVVQTSTTDSATLARLVGFVRALGKTPVVTRDAPGFVVNRVLFPYLGEAILMFAEGHDIETIDRSIRDFGMPMGPLELLDQVGLDVAEHVARTLAGVLPGVEPVVEVLSKLIENNYLGRKNSKGFYHYVGGKRKHAMNLRSLIPANKPEDAWDEFLYDGLSLVQRRLVYPMLAEAIRCHDQRVVEEPWAADLAMILGTGFAPHRGGPLRFIDVIGNSVVLANMKRFQKRHGDRFAPPDSFVQRVKNGESYFTVDAMQASS